jgi:hypothetical protein
LYNVSSPVDLAKHQVLYAASGRLQTVRTWQTHLRADDGDHIGELMSAGHKVGAGL